MAGYVIVYEHHGYGGASMRVTSDIDDMEDYRISRRHDWGDKVSSVKWNIPVGQMAILFSDDDYRGRRVVLNGTGEEESFYDLKDQRFGDKCSSIGFYSS